MRIITLPDFLGFYDSFDESSIIYVCLSNADVELQGDNLAYLDYGRWSWKRRRLVYNGKVYQVKRDNEASTLLLSSYKNGLCYLVDNDGERLAGKPEIVNLIVNNSFDRDKRKLWRDGKVIGTLFIRMTKTIFVLVDLKSEEIKMLEDIEVTNPYLLDEVITFFNNDDWHVYSLDHNLNTIWKYRPDVNFSSRFIRGPEVYDDLVIISFGTSRSETFPGLTYKGRQYADESRSFDSNLYGLNLADGSLRWHVVIPKTIDNMIIQDGKLYISSTNEIHVLDPSTGDTLKVVDTGLSEYVDQMTNPSSLHIQGDKLFFCHTVDACILVYKLDDLQLIKRIDIPEPYTIKDFEYHHEATGRLYFNLKARFPRLYYHTSPILELDPNGLDSDIELVTGPPVEIELRPSETNKNETEIWVTIRDVPLDEAMVYAEMHTEDHAFYHGTNGMFEVLYKTNEFNGKVHFRYSGSDRPVEEVSGKLQILEKRFVDWGRTIAFASTDPSQNATLEAQYIE